MRPSQVVQLLTPYDLPLLMVVAVRSQQRRQAIRQFLSHGSRVKPLLDGNDLKQLGYKPGKEFKLILAAVLQAPLDGEIGDREGAMVSDRPEVIGFVRERYPV